MALPHGTFSLRRGLTPFYLVPLPTTRLNPLCYLPQACKMFNYTHRRQVCNSLFLIFSLVFFYTRLVLFPTQ